MFLLLNFEHKIASWDILASLQSTIPDWIFGDGWGDSVILGGRGERGVDIHFLEGSCALGFVFTSWNIIISRQSSFSALTSKKLLALISYTRFSWKECRGKFQIRLNMKDGPLYKNKLKLKDVNIYAKHHTWRRSKLIAFL